MIEYTEKDIIVYKNFFEPEDFETILHHLNEPRWKWGHFSAPSYDNDMTWFWKMELSKEEFFSKYLLDVIKEKTNENERNNTSRSMDTILYDSRFTNINMGTV